MGGEGWEWGGITLVPYLSDTREGDVAQSRCWQLGAARLITSIQLFIAAIVIPYQEIGALFNLAATIAFERTWLQPRLPYFYNIRLRSTREPQRKRSRTIYVFYVHHCKVTALAPQYEFTYPVYHLPLTHDHPCAEIWPSQHSFPESWKGDWSDIFNPVSRAHACVSVCLCVCARVRLQLSKATVILAGPRYCCRSKRSVPGKADAMRAEGWTVRGQNIVLIFFPLHLQWHLSARRT